jgi:hypothetical protein
MFSLFYCCLKTKSTDSTMETHFKSNENIESQKNPLHMTRNE